MTLEEAIKHYKEVTDQLIKLADKWEAEGGSEYGKTMACKRCAKEHHQLAEWLTELKKYRMLKHTVANWIPCSERLPEEKDAGILKKLGTNKRSDYVIATVEVKGERMTVTACTYDGAWDWNMKYAFPDYEIIAWMPLPEPYNPESEE